MYMDIIANHVGYEYNMSSILITHVLFSYNNSFFKFCTYLFHDCIYAIIRM